MKLSEEQKLVNKLLRQKTKLEKSINDKIFKEKNQKPIAEITINIEWKRSRTWGNCPRCEAKVHFKDGTWETSPTYAASGCGYDKESTVIANVFNDYLKYKLWNRIDTLTEKCKEVPYGIHSGKYKTNFDINVEHCSFDGGIGTNCYYSISKFIGGKFENVASGKTFDAFKYTDSE